MTTMDYTRYVDPFLGNGTIHLPEPQGIAATWFFIKAQTGNTHPGACVPFGMVSACPYSGAYVTGYGLNAPNSHARPPQPFDRYTASGVTHFHPSGTGAVGVYGNCIRVTPQCGERRCPGERWSLVEETARPGYYAARLAETGVELELTVTERTAHHRYTFPGSGPVHLVLDFACGGLDFPGRDTHPSEAWVALAGDNAVQGRVLMEGIPVHVYAEVDVAPSSQVLWTGDQQIRSATELTADPALLQGGRPFGAALSWQHGGTVCVHLGFSLRSVAQARANLRTAADHSFDQLAAEAGQTWNEALSRVHVEDGSPERLQMLYSALYHSLIKPADCTGESPFWPDNRSYWVDFATLWDQYKTQLPLILTCWPERGARLVNGLLALGEHLGEFPTGVLMSTDFHRFDNQARGLALHTLADAYHRNLQDIDWDQALALMAGDLRKERNRDFREQGITQRPTHTLDLADACACTARLAQARGHPDVHAEFAPLARRWRNAYDPRSGLLREGDYYEGGLWNYSFRLLHDMAARVGLFSSEADFMHALDRFFGYGQPPVRQPVDADDREYMQWGFSLNRFEGLNNEPDIETPYAYLYAGRPDRTAEVVRAAMQYMFTTGRGGLPGNDDSGGLSSWYVWNALGLFPVTGQPLYLIGSPWHQSSSIQAGRNTLRIHAPGASPTCPYVQWARLNGDTLEQAWLTVDQVHRGGKLELGMGGEPSTWARNTRPPSFPV